MNNLITILARICDYWADHRDDVESEALEGLLDELERNYSEYDKALKIAFKHKESFKRLAE